MNSPASNNSSVTFDQTKVNVDGNASVFAKKDLVLKGKSTTTRSRSGEVTTKKTRVEEMQFNVGGHASLESEKTLSLTAADINAGGDIALAGKKINLNAAKEVTHRADTQGRTQWTEKTITHKVVDLNSGGNIILNSQGDINAQGTQFNAADDASGNIIINAKGDTNLTAVHNENYSYHKKVKKRSFGRKKTTTKESLKITSQGVGISGGGNLLMNIDVDENGEIVKLKSGDINFEGSDIDVGGNTVIYSDNDVNVYAAVDFDYSKTRVKKRGAFGLSSSDKGSTLSKKRLAATNLKSREGDLSLLSGNNINVVASNLESGGDINLEAYNDVLIAAGEEITEETSWDIEGGFLKGGNLYEEEIKRSGTTTNDFVGSSVFANNNINITAGRATVIGSDLVAGNNINATTDVGDIEILAAEATTDSYEYERSISVGFGDAIKGLTDVGGMVDGLVDSGQLKVTLAKADYSETDSQTDTTTNVTSTLQANNNITLDAAGDITLEGAVVIADADEDAPEGSTSEGNINLLAGGDVNIVEVTDKYGNVTKETEATAELSFTVQNEYDQVVRSVEALDDSKDNLKQAEEDYRQYKKDLDKQKDNLAQLEQAYANNEPGVSYADIVELKDIIQDAEGDDEWYQANIALATVDVASKTTAVAQTTASAAQSTGTYGFNAGLQLDLSGRKSVTDTQETTSIGSLLDGNNINVFTGRGGNVENTSVLIQGSSLNANNNLNISTGQLDILASKDTYQTSNNTEELSASISQTVYGAAGGPNVSMSASRSQSDDRSTTYTNSQLSANNINITTTGDTNIIGGNVAANNSLVANIGGDLLIESVQNRSSGSSKSAGLSGGSGGSIGANASKGNFRSRETVLSSLTSGGTADINVDGHTQLNGALLATIDDEGNDLGNLNLTTTTFGYEDLSNTSYSSDTSSGINTSVNLGQSPSVGNTSLQLSNDSSYSKTKTLATLGQGNLTIRDDVQGCTNVAGAGCAGATTSRLNRDVTNTDKDLYSIDRQQGNIDVTVDTRLLTEEGRQQIKNDFVDSYEFGEDIYRAASTLNQDDQLGLLNFWGALHNNAQGTQLKNDLLRNPENAHILEGIKAGGDQYAQAMDELSKMAQAKFGIDIADLADTNFYDASATTSSSLADNLLLDRKGGTVAEEGHSEYGNIFIDANSDKTDHVNTLGHEVYESITLQQGGDNNATQEALANAFGNQFEDRINQAAGGDLNSTGGPNFRQNLLLSNSVFAGTERANSVGNAKVNHRQYVKPEARMLDDARATINANSALTPEQKQQQLLVLEATACAAVQCAHGVNITDQHKFDLTQLQTLGEQLQQEGMNIQAVMENLNVDTEYTAGSGRSKTDKQAFGYTAIDQSYDYLSREVDPINQIVANSMQAGLEFTVGGIAYAMGAEGFSEYMREQATATANQQYQSQVGNQVQNSMSEATWQQAPDYALDTLLTVMEVAPVAGAAVKGGQAAVKGTQALGRTVFNQTDEVYAITDDVTKVTKGSSNVHPDLNIGQNNPKYSPELQQKISNNRGQEFESRYGHLYDNDVEANAAAKVYLESTKSGNRELVLGRLPDTKAGSEVGMQRLNNADWTLKVNDAWVQGGIDSKKNFYLGSSETPGNLWDSKIIDQLFYLEKFSN